MWVRQGTLTLCVCRGIIFMTFLFWMGFASLHPPGGFVSSLLWERHTLNCANWVGRGRTMSMGHGWGVEWIKKPLFWIDSFHRNVCVCVCVCVFACMHMCVCVREDRRIQTISCLSAYLYPESVLICRSRVACTQICLTMTPPPLVSWGLQYFHATQP